MKQVLSAPRECATMNVRTVTPQEKTILDLISEIGYGSLLDVDLPNERPYLEVPFLSSPRQKFLQAVRSGYLHFDVIVVHQGEPQYAEAWGNKDGIRYKKRIRFQE